ncbi:DUF547 domain-containing protein [Altererythrobacter sp.]|nr:DUF547 domain-containing protein [Altererythrobacter sp.]
MLTRTARPNVAPPHMSRRMFIAAVPATALLAACAPEAGDLGEESFTSDAASTATIDHFAWDALLKEYVVEGGEGINLVEYGRMNSEASAALASYLTAMQATDIETFSPSEQYAFWVNLYNAATIDVILKNWPVGSIRDIGVLSLGPWDDEAVTVSGRKLTLNNIEHDILRSQWDDVRVHYAVNCASIGCPNLAREAYTGAKLEAMLDAAAKAYINHPRGFGGENGAIIASSIFDWYQDDWGSVQAVLDHARNYADGPAVELLAGATSIDSYNYDWDVNTV